MLSDAEDSNTATIRSYISSSNSRSQHWKPPCSTHNNSFCCCCPVSIGIVGQQISTVPSQSFHRPRVITFFRNTVNNRRIYQTFDYFRQMIRKVWTNINNVKISNHGSVTNKIVTFGIIILWFIRISVTNVAYPWITLSNWSRFRWV